MKITDKERERVISLYGAQMSVADITKEINKDKPEKLHVSRQAISKILKSFKSCATEKKVAPATNNKEVAKTIYDGAMRELKNKISKASATELLKIIDYYDIKYNFSDDNEDEKITAISVEIEDASGDDKLETED